MSYTLNTARVYIEHQALVDFRSSFYLPHARQRACGERSAILSSNPWHDTLMVIFHQETGLAVRWPQCGEVNSWFCLTVKTLERFA